MWLLQETRITFPSIDVDKYCKNPSVTIIPRVWCVRASPCLTTRPCWTGAGGGVGGTCTGPSWRRPAALSTPSGAMLTASSQPNLRGKLSEKFKTTFSTERVPGTEDIGYYSVPKCTNKFQGQSRDLILTLRR